MNNLSRGENDFDSFSLIEAECNPRISLPFDVI